MIKFRPVWAHGGCLVLVLGAFGCLVYSLPVSAGVLGKAVAHADGNGAVVIEIPVNASREELVVMTAGGRGGASCADCAAPPLHAVVGESTEGGGVLRITAPVPQKQPYLEFQAWIEWEQEGRLSGDLRNYKVNLPGIPRAASASAASMEAPQLVAAAREQPAGDSIPRPVTRSASRSGVVQYEAAAAEADAGRFVADWIKAWSSRDMDRYLGFYAEDFRLPTGVSRSGWESLRRQRILGRKGQLQVEFEKLVVESATPDQLNIRFIQTYRSAGYSSMGTKSMLLVMRNGAWKIMAESMSDERPLPN